MLPLLTLLLSVAAAQEAPPAPAEPAPSAEPPAPPLAPAPEAVEPAPEVPAAPLAPIQGSYDDALRVVDRLIAEEAWSEARGILNWLLQSDKPEDVQARARARLAALPKAGSGAARVRLLPWQTAMGAWLLGPNIILMNEARGSFNTPPLLVFSGALLGGAGGAAASLLYKREEGLSHGQVSAIVHAEQLGMLHGAYLSLLVPDGEYWEYSGWGLLGGGVAGAAAGYALAELPLDDGAMEAARLGGMWGAGMCWLTIWGVNEDFWEYEPLHDAWPFLVATDLGTAGGYVLGRALKLRRVDAQMMMLGSLAGAGTGLGFAAATSEMILWSGQGVALTSEVFAIGGGVLGYVLARGIERPLPNVTASALLSGTDEDPVVALPLPMVARTPDGFAASVQLVDLQF